jgi:ABC-type xylose transport system permease subunit
VLCVCLFVSRSFLQTQMRVGKNIYVRGGWLTAASRRWAQWSSWTLPWWYR